MFRFVVVAALCLTANAACALAQDAHPAVSDGALFNDWLQQDLARIDLPEPLASEREALRRGVDEAPESIGEWPTMPVDACFTSRDDAEIESRLVRLALDDMQTREVAQSLRRALSGLEQANVPGAEPRWKTLYTETCKARRAERLKPLLDKWPRLVFDRHARNPRSWKYTEAISNARATAPSQWFFSPGGSLNVLHLDSGVGTVETLLEAGEGMLRNPDVSFDGRRLLFAWKKSCDDDDFSLYEMDLQTRGIRQLTDAPRQADYEGIYLPDGNILFNSTRCVQVVDCNWVEVSNFYLMDGDGRLLRRLGFDQVHTIFPTLADDGRVLYTRWDYNDRGQIFTQPLFQMNGDGTLQRGLYGGNSWFPTNIIHARKIPGSREILAIVTGHHTPAHGKVAVIDPGVGREEGHGIELLAPVRTPEPIRVDKYGQAGAQYQYPYPIDSDRFLVTASFRTPDGQLGPFNIYMMDRSGRRELLVTFGKDDDVMGCRQVVPLASRETPFDRSSPVDLAEEQGTFFIQDVYAGAGLQGVDRWRIDRVRVVALDFRTIGVGTVKHAGAGGSSSVSTPVAVGHGSWDVKTVLGSARVHEDGSAFFTAPANRPLYFQALDADGRVIQTMRSWTTLMPGENQACVGCHESKNTSPLASVGLALALADGPEALQPTTNAPTVCGFSYPRDVQPILDRHCIECHDGQDADRQFDLRGEIAEHKKMQRAFTRSYLELTHATDGKGDWRNSTVNWIDAMSGPGPLPPCYKGSSTSGICDLLLAGHEGVKLSDAEFRTLACWIDLLVPFCGDYDEANTWSARDREAFDDYCRLREEFERELPNP